MNRKPLIILIVALLFMVLFLPFPQKISASYTGYGNLSADDTQGQQVTVVLDGMHYRYLIRPDKNVYKGVFRISCDPVTCRDQMNVQIPMPSTGINSLFYFSNDQAGEYFGGYYMPGYMVTPDHFKTIYIKATKDSSYEISVPAYNAEEFQLVKEQAAASVHALPD